MSDISPDMKAALRGHRYLIDQRDKEIASLRHQLADERERAEQHAFTLRQFLDFVQRERALRDSQGKGGQHTGNSPSISPSVLHELERYTRHAPSTVEWVGDKLKKAEAELEAERARHQITRGEVLFVREKLDETQRHWIDTNVPCRDLPEAWMLCLYMERGAATLELIDTEGQTRPIAAQSPDYTLPEQIQYAVNQARREAGE